MGIGIEGLSYRLLSARDFDFSSFGCVFALTWGKSLEDNWAAPGIHHKSLIGIRRSYALSETSAASWLEALAGCYHSCH